MKNRRMKKYISFILVTLLFTACGTDETKLEKVQRERQEVVNVKSMVKEIDTGEVLIGSVARLFSSEKYLLIADSKGYDRLIHLFDNKEYRHVCSVGQLGQGPYEITNMGMQRTSQSTPKSLASHLPRTGVDTTKTTPFLPSPPIANGRAGTPHTKIGRYFFRSTLSVERISTLTLWIAACSIFSSRPERLPTDVSTM